MKGPWKICLYLNVEDMAADPHTLPFTYGIRSKPEDKSSKSSQDTVASSTPTFSSTLSSSILGQQRAQPDRPSRSPARRFSTAAQPQAEEDDCRPPFLGDLHRKTSKDFAAISSDGSRILARLNVNESHLKQKIQALEDTVAEYERQKFNVMGTFAEYRERVVERERKLEAEYSAKIITLSEDVLVAKKDFEDRMKQFQALQEKFEREKEQALEKLREEHQKEIQSLEGRCSETHLLNLEQKYILEIQRLEEERKSLKVEKEKLGEGFESKLRRAQSLYETELTAAKCLYRTELEAFQDHEEALKDELIGRQEEFRDRLDDLQLQFCSSKEELAKWKQEVVELEERLQHKESEVQTISKQLREAKKDTDDAIARVHIAESELKITKQKCHEHEEQLMRKSDMLAVIESAKNKLENVIQELQVELKSLKGKVAFLENERQNLESQSQTQAQLNDKQLQTFEKVLGNVSQQNENVKEEYEQKLENERVIFEQREFTLKQEYMEKLSEIEKQHKDFQTKFDVQLSEEREKISEELKLITAKEIDELKFEKDFLQKELENVKNCENLNSDQQATVVPHICDFHQNHKRELAEIKADLERKLRAQIQNEKKSENSEIMPKSENIDQVRELHQFIDQLNSTIESLNGKIDQLEKVTIEELKQKLDSTLRENEDLNNNLGLAKRELEGYKAAQNSKIEELSQQIDLQHRKYREHLEQEKSGDKESDKRREELEKILSDTKEEMNGKQKQLEKMKEQVEGLKSDLLAANRELLQKTQEIDEIKSGTKGYIKTRENQQSKKHHVELENLRKQHEIEMQKLVEAKQQLMTEKEALLKKINEAQSASASGKSTVDKNEKRAAEVEKLDDQLKQKDGEIKKLKGEKHSLEHETVGHCKSGPVETAKEVHLRSIVSPPIGSMDSLKKRDSICSVGSVKEVQLCRKANMAIVNKWQCLVDQMKNGSGSRRRDSRASLHSLPPVSTKVAGGPSTSGTTTLPGRHTHHVHSHRQFESQDSTNSATPSNSSSQQKLHIDEAEERAPRAGAKSPVPGGLRPHESRRSSGKSPSRSPAPMPKTPSGAKKPLWRV